MNDNNDTIKGVICQMIDNIDNQNTLDYFKTYIKDTLIMKEKFKFGEFEIDNMIGNSINSLDSITAIVNVLSLYGFDTERAIGEPLTKEQVYTISQASQTISELLNCIIDYSNNARKQLRVLQDILTSNGGNKL
jgi:hypothetical protein